jgi:DNA-binding MarR family transcriptional regulator
VAHGTGDFGWSLGVLARRYRHAVAAACDVPHGPRGYDVLVAVVHGDQPNQLALAAHLGIDRTVMTYVIDDLVAAGLVERRQNPADRRSRKVVATALGAQTLTALEQRVSEAEAEILGALSEAERETFRTLLRRIAVDSRDVDPDEDPCTAVREMMEDEPVPAAG